ncbi:MAG: tetratricopeptide repeat protein [Fibrobacterota bacterium]
MVKDVKKFPVSVAVLLIILAAIVPYLNTFNASFQFDDESAIVANGIVQKGSPTEIIRAYPHRFVGYFSFALNYRLHGLSVTGYHIVNITIHVLASLLLFAFARMLMRSPTLRGNAGERTPLFAALLFAVHPVQTQAVTYIVQRLASLAALWYLLSLTAYVKARLIAVGEASGGITRDAPVGRLYGWVMYAIAIAAGVLGMFTKETVATLPLAIVLIEAFFFCDRLPELRSKWKTLLPFLLLLLIVPVNYILMGKAGAAGIADLLPGDQQAIPRFNYLLTQFNVVRTYLWLTLCPVSLNLDYDIPVTPSLFHGFTFPSFLLIAALIILGVRLYRRDRLLSFGVLFFFLALSVESSLLPIWDVCFEHRLYLPLIGFALVVPRTLERFVRNTKLYTGLLAAVVLVLGMMTHERNKVWQTPLTLWEDVVKKAPGKARGHNNLGMAYAEKKQTREAFLEYQAAVRIRPKYDDARYNLGNLYREAGRPEKAVEEYRIVLAYHPDYVKAWLNLGVAWFALGKNAEAAAAYRQVMRLDPRYPDAYYNMGNLYLRSAIPDSAILYYTQALAVRPVHAGTYNNIGVAYMQAGRAAEGIAAFRRALEIVPGFPDAIANLKDALGGKR